MFKHRENQADLISKKPFIFSESKSDISKDDYMAWAISRMKSKGQKVFVFDVPHPYKFDLLDKYRDRLLCTSYNANPNGGTSYLCSIFQLKSGEHIIATYHFDVENLNKDFISALILSSEPDAIITFMQDNKDLQDSFESTSRLGFAKK